MSTVKYDPTQDGIDHVNIYTKSQCKLGRLLSNMSSIPINHPEHGWFRTLEGFWTWLSTGGSNEQLRVANGYEARAIGKTLKKQIMPVEEFEGSIKMAIDSKVKHSSQLRRLLMDSGDLPIVHYYNYSGKIVVPKGHQWQLDYWTQLRHTLQQ